MQAIEVLHLTDSVSWCTATKILRILLPSSLVSFIFNSSINIVASSVHKVVYFILSATASLGIITGQANLLWLLTLVQHVILGISRDDLQPS